MHGKILQRNSKPEEDEESDKELKEIQAKYQSKFSQRLLPERWDGKRA